MVSYNKKCKGAWLAGALSICALLRLPLANAGSSWVSTGIHPLQTGNAPFLGYLEPTHPLTVVVVLRVRNRAQLDSTVESLLTPGSPNYGHWLTHQQVMQRFAPTVADADRAAAYLKSKGFTNVTISPSRRLVVANGTAAGVLAAFNTNMAYFQKGSRVAYANTDDVKVPATLSSTVSAVLGLQDLYRVHTDQEVTVHSAADFATIYDAASLPNYGAHTVGIISYGDMSVTKDYDLPAFENYYHISVPVEYVTVGIGSTPIVSDNSVPNEWDLDSQTILGMGGATVNKLIFYDAVDCDTTAGTGGSSTCVDAGLTEAYDAAVSADSAQVINISLGICEAAAHADYSMASDDSIFEEGAAQGQVFVASSGDDGAYCNTGTGVSSAPEVEYPASSPYVIAVGGTTLSTNSNGTYSGETAWGGSGGGPSAYEPMPSWQKGIVPGSMRGVPDLAFDADPQSGESVAYSYSCLSGSLCWADVGGTSLAAPILVGGLVRSMAADGYVNRGDSLAVSWFYGAYKNGLGGPLFHDITSGNNGYYSAGPGWDYVTGFGSLNFTTLVDDTVPKVRIK